MLRQDLKLRERLVEAACRRSDWRHTYSSLVADHHQRQLRPASPQGLAQCKECERVFRRVADRTRHKCTAEAYLRAVRWGTRCHRWLRSKGGLAVHRCHSILRQLNNRTGQDRCVWVWVCQSQSFEVNPVHGTVLINVLQLKSGTIHNYSELFIEMNSEHTVNHSCSCIFSGHLTIIFYIQTRI